MTSTPVNNADVEKAGNGLSFAEPRQPTLKVPHPHVNEWARGKIRHFLHPNGRRHYVANSPEEVEDLRKKLEAVHKETDFDISITGTPEHLSAVRAAQEHHEARRDELRSQHKDVYDRFANVHAELDMLSNELERVTTHGVSLEAHFSKYGYDAHIKSYDDEPSPSHSGTNTPRSSIDQGRTKATESDQKSPTPLKLFKLPVVRQYFHKGILWRGSKSEEVQSFELFVDLLYVGIIAINGDAASEDPTGQALLRFVITFLLSWKIWNDMTLVVSWFETDDVFQRFSILFLLACLFGFTTCITQAYEHTYPTLIGFYLTSRLFMSAYLALVAYILPMVRGVMVYHVCTALVGSALWIGSIHVENPYRLALIFISMFFEIFGQTGYIFLMMFCYRVGGKLKAWYDEVFAFYPAINIEHRTERMNSFVTLVFGYTVVAIVYQSAVNGIDAFFGKAVLGLIQAFCFNWIYFEIDGANLTVHAIRRAKETAFIWSVAHLPCVMSVVLAGGALSRLVVATDTPDARVEHLTEAYQGRSEPEIRAGIRWFYCVGLGVALACMGFISISHIHKEVEGLRLKKRYRLVWRFAVATILIFLPLADRLNSLELIGVVTALVVIVLSTELWFGCSCNEKLFQRSKPCQYFGRLGKREMEALVKDGKEVDVDELVSEKMKLSGVAIGP